MTTHKQRLKNYIAIAESNFNENANYYLWGSWNEIAQAVIPKGYTSEDAKKDVLLHPLPPYSPDDWQWWDSDARKALRISIIKRFHQISDRLDPARCFALDREIRHYYGYTQRP